MRCEKAQELFSDHLEGSLERPMKVAVDQHMAECGECRVAFESFATTWQMLGELPQIEAPAGFASGVVMAIRMEQEARLRARPWWQTAWSNMFTTRVPAKVFAAAVAVFLCVQIVLNTPIKGVLVGGTPQFGPTAPDLGPMKWVSSPAEAWLNCGVTLELDGSRDAAERSICRLLIQPKAVTSKEVNVYLMNAGPPHFDDASIERAGRIFSDTIEGNGRIIPFVLGRASGRQEVMTVLVEWNHRQRRFLEAVFIPVQMAPAGQPVLTDLRLRNVELYYALQQVSSTYGVVILAQADVSQMVRGLDIKHRSADDALYELTRSTGMKYRPLGPQVFAVERRNE